MVAKRGHLEELWTCRKKDNIDIFPSSTRCHLRVCIPEGQGCSAYLLETKLRCCRPN